MTIRLFYLNMGPSPVQNQALTGFNRSWKILSSGILQIGADFYFWASYDDMKGS